MTELLFASHNKNKTKEIAEILGNEYTIVTLSDLNITEPIEESASTLEGNALIKARYLYQKYKKPCFADDSGLEVEALDGNPGVYSARYAGEDNNAMANMTKLLHNLEGCSNRKAQFRTVIAYICTDGEYIFEGTVKGQITTEMKGSDGFGYDPVFQPDNSNGKTFAQMSPEEKNSISHRALALNEFTTFIQQHND